MFAMWKNLFQKNPMIGKTAVFIGPNLSNVWKKGQGL
jgi:hypothetical protein